MNSHPPGSIWLGRIICERPIRMPSIIHARASRTRAAVTQKPSAIESHGMKRSVISAKVHHGRYAGIGS